MSFAAYEMISQGNQRVQDYVIKTIAGNIHHSHMDIWRVTRINPILEKNLGVYPTKEQTGEVFSIISPVVADIYEKARQKINSLSSSVTEKVLSNTYTPTIEDMSFQCFYNDAQWMEEYLKELDSFRVISDFIDGMAFDDRYILRWKIPSNNSVDVSVKTYKILSLHIRPIISKSFDYILDVMDEIIENYAEGQKLLKKQVVFI